MDESKLRLRFGLPWSKTVSMPYRTWYCEFCSEIVKCIHNPASKEHGLNDSYITKYSSLVQNKLSRHARLKYTKEIALECYTRGQRILDILNLFAQAV